MNSNKSDNVNTNKRLKRKGNSSWAYLPVVKLFYYDSACYTVASKVVAMKRFIAGLIIFMNQVQKNIICNRLSDFSENLWVLCPWNLKSDDSSTLATFISVSNNIV